MYSVLGGKIFANKSFNQPLMSENQPGIEQNTDRFQTQNLVLNDLFVHKSTCYYAQSTIFL